MSSVGHAQLAAVADDGVGAAGAGHREALVLGALLGDEVEHDLGALAVRHVEHGVDRGAVGHDGLVRPELLGQLQRLGVAVDHDDPGGGERGQALDADVAEPAGADHDGGGAGVEVGDHLADRVVRRDPGVGQGRDVLGPGLGVELHAGAGGGLEVLRHPAVRAVQPGEDRLHAVHVVAGAARVAQPAGRRRVQDHGVADGDVGDAVADRLDPAGVLVAEDVGQRRAHPLVPLTEDDVQVGAADAGPADLDDHVERPGDLGLGHVVDDGLLVVAVEADGLHGVSCSEGAG